MSTETRGPTGRLPPRTYGEYCERLAERVVSRLDGGRRMSLMTAYGYGFVGGWMALAAVVLIVRMVMR